MNKKEQVKKIIKELFREIELLHRENEQLRLQATMDITRSRLEGFNDGYDAGFEEGERRAVKAVLAWFKKKAFMRIVYKQPDKPVDAWIIFDEYIKALEKEIEE